jgi:hypothetical protein
MMIHPADHNIDAQTIREVGLLLTDEPINAQIAPDARVLKYPSLEKVYVMESDLYGNTMPKGSCFLVFDGHHGLVGKHLLVETLRSVGVEGIRSIIETNSNA